MPPSHLRSRLAERLSADPQVAEVLARWDRWGADLWVALERIYGPVQVADRVVELIAEGHLERSAELRHRDRDRTLSPDWFQRSDAIGYAAYTDRLAGTLGGVTKRIDYLCDLGVTYLHLMPLLQTRPGPNDGGYAVMDYKRVRPELGTMDDLETLASGLHDAGISLTLDLVLNHVAAEHSWARAARSGDDKYARYFMIFPDRAEPDAFELNLPEVFPEWAPGNFTWDEEAQGWVWTTFHSWQWDLNWANPDVFCEFVRIILDLANRGVDCLRLDAIAFLWKRLGTNCQNQPEVHIITQALRAMARIASPNLIFKAEAIVSPDELVAYLGRGDRAGRVSDLAYHNSLMVQIWSALATRDARLMAVALSRFTAIPTTAAWATYLRCHDDIGWAVDDADAQVLGLEGVTHRAFLSDFYAGSLPDSFAEGYVFQENPANGDRRISGSAASLAGLGTATGAAERAAALDRVLCGYAMVLGFGGMPLIYMGDEIALRNDDDFARVPEHADDNRWVHRPQMPWEVIDALEDSPGSDAALMYRGLRRLIEVRKRLESFHAAVSTKVVVTSLPSVVCFVRHHPAGDMVQMYNVSDVAAQLPVAEIEALQQGATYDQIREVELVPQAGMYRIAPYAALWLTKPPGSEPN